VAAVGTIEGPRGVLKSGLEAEEHAQGQDVGLHRGEGPAQQAGHFRRAARP